MNIEKTSKDRLGSRRMPGEGGTTFSKGSSSQRVGGNDGRKRGMDLQTSRKFRKKGEVYHKNGNPTSRVQPSGRKIKGNGMRKKRKVVEPLSS